MVKKEIPNLQETVKTIDTEQKTNIPEVSQMPSDIQVVIRKKDNSNLYSTLVIFTVLILAVLVFASLALLRKYNN